MVLLGVGFTEDAAETGGRKARQQAVFCKGLAKRLSLRPLSVLLRCLRGFCPLRPGP